MLNVGEPELVGGFLGLLTSSGTRTTDIVQRSISNILTVPTLFFGAYINSFETSANTEIVILRHNAKNRPSHAFQASR